MSRYLSFVVFVLLGEVNEAVENVLLRGQVPRAVLVDLLKELVDRAHVPAAVIEQAILDGGISVPVLVSCLILNELEQGLLVQGLAVLVAVVLIVCWPYPKLRLL